MFRNIIIPIDLTDKHQQALEIAAQMCSMTEGEVTLVHVIELIPGLSRDEDRDFYSKLENKANSQLGHVKQDWHGPNGACHSKVLFGNRAEEVVRFADEKCADLILLMSHRLDLEQPGARWGTLSYKISLMAQCPVLLVK